MPYAPRLPVRGVSPQALGGNVSPQFISGAVIPQDAANGYVLLASRLFTGATTGDLGRTAGTKSITPAGKSAENWTLVNGTSTFLAADPNGCAIDATGLFLQSGSTASTGQWQGAVSGPYIYKLVSEIVPANLWATTNFLLANMYAYVDIIWIVDATSGNVNGELVNAGMGGTSGFGTGAGGKSGFAGSANSLGGTTQTGTYASTTATSASVSFPGSAMPTAIRVRVNSAGQEIHLGVASGLTPPAAWYSKDNISQTSGANSVTGTSTALNKDMVAVFGVEDTTGGGAFKGYAKALYIYGQRMPAGQTLTIAA